MNIYIPFFLSLQENTTNVMDRNYSNKNFDTNEWALYNMETSEIKKIEGGKMTVTTPTLEVRVNSKLYLYFDTDRLKVLRSNGITDIELGLLILISSNLTFVFNVCMKNEKEPHSSSSISEMMGQSPQAINRKLKRLIELGVLAQKVIPEKKHLGKVYLVNPYLIKRGKNFSEYLSSFFYDFIPNS